MEKNELRKLGTILALKEYCENIIENAKEKFRDMTEEEIKEINEGIFLTITRKDYTKTTYSEEYKTELKKLQEKFPAEKETIKNHTITLNTTSYSASKAEIIANEILTQNKKTIQEMSRVAASKAPNKTTAK